MATTTIQTSSTHAEGPLWRAVLNSEAENEKYMKNFMGTSEDSCFVVYDDFSRNAGDTMTIRFAPYNYTHEGFGEGETIVGNEDSLDLMKDSFVIDYMAFAMGLDSPMSQQRIGFSLYEASMEHLAAKWAYRDDEAILNQLAGYGPSHNGTSYKKCGHNACIAIDDNHHLWAEGTTTYTDDQTLAGDSTATMSMELILKAVTYAASDKHGGEYRIEPDKDGFYHCIMSYSQWRDAQLDLTQNEISDIYAYRTQGGMKEGNAHWERGFLGKYKNVKLHVHDQVPLGVNSGSLTTSVANVRRAVFFGKKALWCGYGKGYTGDNHLDWSEINSDHHRQSIAASCISGFKRSQFNNSSGTTESFATLVLSTYSDV